MWCSLTTSPRCGSPSPWAWLWSRTLSSKPHTHTCSSYTYTTITPRFLPTQTQLTPRSLHPTVAVNNETTSVARTNCMYILYNILSVVTQAPQLLSTAYRYSATKELSTTFLTHTHNTAKNFLHRARFPSAGNRRLRCCGSNLNGKVHPSLGFRPNRQPEGNFMQVYLQNSVHSKWP